MWASRIRNPGLWNREFSSRYPESMFFLQKLESSTRNPDQSTAWNPESKIVLDSLAWDDRVDRPPYPTLESFFEKADSLVSWTKGRVSL